MSGSRPLQGMVTMLVFLKRWGEKDGAKLMQTIVYLEEPDFLCSKKKSQIQNCLVYEKMEWYWA